ncbi:hypothetical protein NC653_008523 [Populus alba x Populus x berolinensis]|uniref:Uncharacterized protein n=1 Tax=Populus alba x Populus x berolinensis TaxID=444605 RepID=A0AAD6R6X5_9ROSI|nr:hypothetical protein NC653_008523 [Populus alba x Populus x berolinensis]
MIAHASSKAHDPYAPKSCLNPINPT